MLQEPFLFQTTEDVMIIQQVGRTTPVDKVRNPLQILHCGCKICTKRMAPGIPGKGILSTIPVKQRE